MGVLEKRGISADLLKSEKRYVLGWVELDEVVDRTLDLLLEVNRVGVLYDVDADGLVSGKIVDEYIQQKGLMVYRMMNDRKKHGITDQVVEWVKKEGIELLYVVDGGTNDIENQEVLSDLGVVVMVLDHHPQTVIKEIKNVYIVNSSIHEHLPELSGAGVCYRFVELLDRETGGVGVTHYEPWVGLTVLSDHCTMLDAENRYYVEKLYKEYNNIDLFKAFTYWGSKRNLFLFGVIPFLNACIRTNHGDWAIEVMKMSGESKVKRFVKETRERVLEEQAEIMDDMLKKSMKQEGKEVVLVRLDNEHIKYSGITGLLANRIINQVKKSVIVFYEEEGYFRGSFRGIDAVTDKELMKTGLKVMGHPQAAGIEVLKGDAGEVFEKVKAIELGNKTPEYDFELEDRGIVRNLEMLSGMARFNEMTGGDLSTIKFKLNRTRQPFKNAWGKKIEYDFQSFRVRDFKMDRGQNEEWIIEPLMDREGIVLLRQ